MCGMLCWNTMKDTCQIWPTSFWAKRPSCGRYRMICSTSSLIRQLHHFATYFDRVLLQLIGTDIVNTLFKYRVSLWHLTLMIETFELLMNTCDASVKVHNKWKTENFVIIKFIHIYYILLLQSVSLLQPGSTQICCIDATASCTNNDPSLRFVWYDAFHHGKHKFYWNL